MDNDPSAGDAVDIGVCLIVDEEVLHGIGLRIESGTVNVLADPPDSGKSTLARPVASLWGVREGVLLPGGTDIRTLPLKGCTDRIAYVSQDDH